MEIKELLFELSKRDAVGHISEAADFAEKELSKYMDVKRQNNLNIIGKIKGDSDYTIMLDAHIDQIAMVVTDIDDKGFLTVSNAGGIDIRALSPRAVTVHGKEKITAVFSSIPPHLSGEEEKYDDISKIKLDSLLGAKAKEVISLGDFVTFKTEPRVLSGDTVSGRSFDNRASVACLLELAKRLSGKRLPISLSFVLSDGEELGLRGIRPACFEIEPDEAIVVDVSFGDGVGISAEECGKLGGGAMLGFSASFCSDISKKLRNIAKENNIPYSEEVMGRSSGTNADMVSVSGKGVKTATVSIPLRNMHTDCEILNLNDLNSVCDLIERYILSGGVLNA